MHSILRACLLMATLFALVACNTSGRSGRPANTQPASAPKSEPLHHGVGPVERQMRRYMQFYFPSSGASRYDIGFKWGHYLITTHPRRKTRVHRSAKRFKRYVTLRPTRGQTRRGERLWVYLITPKGRVWRLPADGRIAKRSRRREVVRKGSGKTTTIIRSVSEPVIIHFKDHRKQWRRYGKMVWKKGARTSRLRLRR